MCAMICISVHSGLFGLGVYLFVAACAEGPAYTQALSHAQGALVALSLDLIFEIIAHLLKLLGNTADVFQVCVCLVLVLRLFLGLLRLLHASGGLVLGVAAYSLLLKLPVVKSQQWKW